MESYIIHNYAINKAKYNIHQQGDDNNQQIIIEISCHNAKLESFWAGEWQSTWTLSNGAISGDLKVRAHYYEGGNISVNLDKQFDSVPCQNTANAAEIVAGIKNIEDEVSEHWLQYILEFSYSDSYFYVE